MTVSHDNAYSTQVVLNNAFERTLTTFESPIQEGYWTITNSPMNFHNNLFKGGGIYLYKDSSHNWVVRDNAFDGNQFDMTWPLVSDHNAYINGADIIFPTNNTDIGLSNFIYATGPLGNFYQGSTNLFNIGSTNAAALGLYHYTVTTNEVVEGTNTVSIGYHYVATDAYGNLLDTNGDGIADYLEDGNGNGIYDTGELGDWQGLNLNVIITRPRNGCIIP